jgi:hypothetical protein
VTIHWLIIAGIAFVIIAGLARRRPGEGLADIVVLVFLFGLIALVDRVVSRFVDTGGIAISLAAAVTFGFALNALYGLMAPERQRRRDRRLRAFMQRMRA